MAYIPKKKMDKQYLSAFAAFVGPTSTHVSVTNVSPRAKPRRVNARASAPTTPKVACPTEAQEQVRLVRWLDFKKVLFTASANGGLRNQWEGVKLKHQGVKAGYPDLIIHHARKGHHGLLIELKRSQGGSVSAAQGWWLKRLNEEGYLAVVCAGAEEAIKVVQAYLSL